MPTKPKQRAVDSPGPLRVAIYVRVSTKDQNCAMQLADLRPYVQARGREGWKLASEYMEQMTSRRQSRPALNAVMAAARLRQIDCIVVWKMDRFGRSFIHMAELVRELESLGVRFISITQGVDTDVKNPTARLLMNILNSVAEWERDTIQERVTAGVRLLIKQRSSGKEGAGAGKGVWGRKARVFDRVKAMKLKKAGVSLRKAAAQLDIGHMTLKRFYDAQ